MTSVLVGVDGGGTHTRAMVTDEAGVQLASSDGIGSAIRPGEVTRSADIVASTIEAAIRESAVEDPQVRIACVGVAGAGREEERHALHEALVSRGIADEVHVVTDAEIALEDAFGDGPGVLLIAGTGSICYGRGPAGAVARCGGWGPIIGDEGSGAWLGRRVLGVVAAAADGREPDTALTAAILATTGVPSVDALVPWASHATVAQLASLAPVIMETAKAGDLRANAIVTLGVEELALHVRTLARQLFVDERATVPLALSGGLVHKGTLVRKRLEVRLRSMVPGAMLHGDEVIAVRGAIKRAMRTPSGIVARQRGG
ncbi:MAG: N-acetylmuramic acid/N-acetylglucosamine kinase [Gemmatimonadaceae bacterium]|nr:N-acetylmuramic acid/N-acetylglucosamine kinase [Gemmatimonadaceae bacterium]